MLKLKRDRKKTEKPEVEKVFDLKQRKRIQLALEATEGYVLFSCIAMGLVQMLAFTHSKEMRSGSLRYLRIPSKEVVSEAAIMHYLRQNIFRIMLQKPHLSIIRFILRKQKQADVQEERQAS